MNEINEMNKMNKNDEIQKNKKIANENYRFILKNKQLIPNTYESNTNDILKLIDSNKKRSFINNLPKYEQKIEIFDMTTTQAIKYYKSLFPDLNIGILNFANSHTPGGGYLRGAKAQEEDLCRMSPFLYASLNNSYNEYYKNWGNLWNLKVLYTPNCLFVRDDNYCFLSNEDIYDVSVVTAAAPNLRHIKNMDDIPSDVLYENLFLNIYFCSHFMSSFNKDIKKTDILILGAIGCGAFSPRSHIIKNYNEFVAYHFIKTISKFSNYKIICFAIPDHI